MKDGTFVITQEAWLAWWYASRESGCAGAVYERDGRGGEFIVRFVSGPTPAAIQHNAKAWYLGQADTESAAGSDVRRLAARD